MTLPVRLKLTGCKFRSALNALLTDTAFAWQANSGQIQILSRSKTGRNVSRSYPIADLVKAGISARQLANTIVYTIAPDAWDFTGGPGKLRPGNQVLEVEQSPRIHEAIHELLNDLRAAKIAKQPDAAPLPSRAGLQAALTTVVKQDCSGKPLSTVLQDLLVDHSLVLEERAILKAGFDIQQPVDEVLKGLPLHAALSKILDQASLVWYVDDDLLRVTTAAKTLSRMQARPFRLPKLDAGQNQATFLSQLQADVAPGDWQAVGGNGSVYDKLPGIVIVRHTPPTLRNVEEYLGRQGTAK